MLVRFPGDPDQPSQSEFVPPDNRSGLKGRTGKFVFAITASGWHSGALAVDLHPHANRISAASSSADGPRIRLRDVPRIQDVNRPGGGGEWNAGHGGEYDMPAGNPPNPPAAQRGPGEGTLFRGVFRVGFAGRGRTRPGTRGPDS